MVGDLAFGRPRRYNLVDFYPARRFLHMGCLFCNLVAKQQPSTVVYEDDKVFCFEDINPLAPVHVVIVPKQHVDDLNALFRDGKMSIMEDMYRAVFEVAKRKGIDHRGFRTVINNGPDGGQIIWHLHLHVLGGKRLGDSLAG
jgi:histidine triad (HIT) family protein